VSVHSGLRQRGTILEAATDGITGYVSEDRSGQRSILPSL
jgi:hypothetical protein